MIWYGKCVQIFQRNLLSLSSGYTKNLHVKGKKCKSQYLRNKNLDCIKWITANSALQPVYVKGHVLVCEGSCGGTWRVMCWYVKGRVVLHEGSRGGTWRVVWWYVKGNPMVHRGRSICTQRVVWWYMKLFFFNCFECMKLKDNICKFQYSRSTTILFEYLCRFSYII